MARSRFNSQAIKFILHILASVLLHSFALVNRHVQPTYRAHRQLPPLLRLKNTDSPQKSPESSFWFAITQKNATGGVPSIPQLVHETGHLPPGAYCSSDSKDGKDAFSPCLIAVGIQPPPNADDGECVWREGVKNCHKLIDSGFNTFRVNDCHKANEDSKSKRHTKSKRSKSPSSIALEHTMHNTLRTEIRHQVETNFYNTLRKSTPPSVLRSCLFMVNLEIPSILSEESVTPGSSKDVSPVPYGNGWMVRESISKTLLRTKGECIDSVVLEYRKNSPYHLDALDTLFDMKREGLIQSISTKNFPPLLLESALGCGFNLFSNDVYGNLMNTNNLEPNSELRVLCNEYGCSYLVSAPLGGGIFTDQFCQFQERSQLSASSKKLFNTLLETCCKVQNGRELDRVRKWKNYRAIVETLQCIALKHQVSVESIALRWLLQLNDGNSISVGTHLGMDFVEEKGGQPYSRHRDFRQVFTFCLEEDDMKRLCQVAGFTSDRNLQSGMTSDEIDFTNKALWM